MENVFGMTAIPSIVVICYLVAQGVKAIGINNKYIPIICGVMGCILGIAAMFIVPDYPANDYLTGAAIGIVSGLSATGVHQIYKQMKTNGNDDTEDKEDKTKGE